MALVAWNEVSIFISIVLVIAALMVVLIAWDLTQKRHTILRNWPILGHFRYLLELVGPELRQYIVTDNNSERPFSRDDRRWIYATSKGEDNRFGFGTDQDLEGSPNFVIVRPAAFAPPGPVPQKGMIVPTAKILGGPRGRREAFRPQSIVNVSGMSFGALSGRAISSLNQGCSGAGALQCTGEGGLSTHHLQGGELIFQLGTGYFGCRDASGRFDLGRLVELCDEHPIRAIEIKLSQGAKPGQGGMLPAAKVTEEIARIRGVEQGVDCVSPAYHSEFRDEDEMLDFVERIAEATGLPVGIKSAVGDNHFWERLASLMESGERGVDFIVVDGGEGGTGAAPLAFTDNVSLPFMLGFAEVIRAFGQRDLQRRVAFAGSGRLGLPARAIEAFALGCDWINVGREAMLSVGCIQAQRCHTGRCPTGVATQNRWLERGIDVEDKSTRTERFIIGLRDEIVALARAAGAVHPAALDPRSVTILDGHDRTQSVAELFGVRPEWSLSSTEVLADLLAQWPPQLAAGAVS